MTFLLWWIQAPIIRYYPNRLRDWGIPLAPCQGPAATAFGGQQITLSYGDIEFELVHPDGNLRWPSRVYFVSGDADKDTLILGHQGFLEYFTATFDGENWTLTLEANEFLSKAKDEGEG